MNILTSMQTANVRVVGFEGSPISTENLHKAPTIAFVNAVFTVLSVNIRQRINTRVKLDSTSY